LCSSLSSLRGCSVDKNSDAFTTLARKTSPSKLGIHTSTGGISVYYRLFKIQHNDICKLEILLSRVMIRCIETLMYEFDCYNMFYLISILIYFV
jgi:hypothetical protein